MIEVAQTPPVFFIRGYNEEVDITERLIDLFLYTLPTFRGEDERHHFFRLGKLFLRKNHGGIKIGGDFSTSAFIT
jgi:hypothetical protein